MSTLVLGAVVAVAAATMPAAGTAAATTPAASEVGVTATQIRIAVVADVDNPISPGLYQANVDAVRAFAKDVNAHGGLAGRQLVVDFYDSHLSASDTQNALIQACAHDFAMVGTGAAFLNDTTPLVSCPDEKGRSTGLPDLTTFSLDPTYLCSPVSFQISPSPLDCATKDQTPQKYRVLDGPAQFYRRQHPGLHGVYVLSGDLKSVRDASLPLVNGWTQTGVRPDGDGTIFVSAEAPRSALTPAVQQIKDHHSTFVYVGVPVAQVASLRAEAALQGVQSVKVWTCSFECYDRTLVNAGGADVDGTYLTTATVPFEEAGAVPALARFVTAIGGPSKATGFGVQAWIAGLLFQSVVKTLAAAGGNDSLTRAGFLTQIRAVHHFTADGILGGTDIGAKVPSDCFAILQVHHGRFVRVYPKARASFDCRASNTRTINLDLSNQ